MVAFTNFPRLVPLPKPKLTYDQKIDHILETAWRQAIRKRTYVPKSDWADNLEAYYRYIKQLVYFQRKYYYEHYARIKSYKRISAEYEAPFTLPIWCRRVYDKIMDFFYNLSSLTFEKWVFWLVFFYFVYVFITSIFYPLYNAVRTDFLHPRFFFRSPRWFVDENRLHRQTKFVLIYNMVIILMLIMFFLFYLYEVVRFIQYYDCYVYYRHLYHTIPFFEGGSSSRNGGVHSDLAWKKRLRHPERSAPSYYFLLVKDRW